MSRYHTSFTSSIKPQSNSSTYYIVKDDFIVNLKRGCHSRPRREESSNECVPYEIKTSSLMVKKKKEILGKMKFRGNNNFYDLDRQIQDNRRCLYRKLHVAFGRSRVECKLKLQNPFEQRKQAKSSPKFFNNQKTLERIIYNVQPYWIKKSIKKDRTKIIALTSS